MKNYKNYLKVGIFTLAGLFVSCDKDSNEDINEDLSTNENQELIDDSLAKDLENFDHIKYQNKTYDFSEILSNDALLLIYKNAEYLGIDESDSRTILIFDSEEESNREMNNIEEHEKRALKLSHRDYSNEDYWAARVRVYTNVNFSGSVLTYNFRTTFDRRYSRNMPNFMQDKASSIKIDRTTFSKRSNFGGPIYRKIYITCYEDYNSSGDKITDKISHEDDNGYYSNLHSEGWGDKISSIRVGDVVSL